jgi:hypothetical protein
MKVFIARRYIRGISSLMLGLWLSLATPMQAKAEAMSLIGDDSNRNGVRDDVEAAINLWYPKGEKVNRLATEMAKIKQTNTTQNLSDEAIRSFYEQSSILGICLMEIGVDVDDLLARLQAAQFNTPKRLEAMHAYERRLASLGVFELPSDEVIAMRCANF